MSYLLTEENNQQTNQYLKQTLVAAQVTCDSGQQTAMSVQTKTSFNTHLLPSLALSTKTKLGKKQETNRSIDWSKNPVDGLISKYRCSSLQQGRDQHYFSEKRTAWSLLSCQMKLCPETSRPSCFLKFIVVLALEVALLLSASNLDKNKVTQLYTVSMCALPEPSGIHKCSHRNLWAIQCWANRPTGANKFQLLCFPTWCGPVNLFFMLLNNETSF